MTNWLTALYSLIDAGTPCVVVTVAQTTGSAPREAGAKLIVTGAVTFGTIGGGNLELQAIAIGREQLSQSPPPRPRGLLHRFALGPMLDQCCGGTVCLQFERFDPPPPPWLAPAQATERNGDAAVLVTLIGERCGDGDRAGYMLVSDVAVVGDLGVCHSTDAAVSRARALLRAGAWTATAELQPLGAAAADGKLPVAALLLERIGGGNFNVALFGAGHVGRAIVATLAPAVPCRVIWIDSRADQFPGDRRDNVTKVISPAPVAEVERLPAHSFCVVMTHSHALDQALCEAILRRGDFAYLGLIGSDTKRRRFINRLRGQGFTDQELARLTCPIGIAGIVAKHPGAIAISVAAQLLTVREQRNAGSEPQAAPACSGVEAW